MSTTITGTTEQPSPVILLAPSLTGTPSSTGTTSSPSTTPIPPTTNAMNYCTEQIGMNQPLNIQPSDIVSTNPPLDQTQLSTSDINPTSDKPGFTFDTINPIINIKLPQDATLTNIYVPIDKPSNVEQFTVTFFYPNGTDSPTFTSQIPSAGQTTPSGLPLQTTTTPSSIGRFVPSDMSPQIVDLPSNFQVPKDTIVEITITRTTDNNQLFPTNVCIIVLHFISRFRFSVTCF